MRHQHPTPNVFTPTFLAALEPEDDPLTATEAAAAGPWAIVPWPAGGWAVVRRREAGAAGARPAAVFVHRQTARLAAAALPLVGRDGSFRLDREAGPRGFAVRRHGRAAGHLPWFHAELVAALDLFDGLVRSPEAMAEVLAAAGPTALGLAGAALAGAEVTGAEVTGTERLDPRADADADAEGGCGDDA